MVKIVPLLSVGFAPQLSISAGPGPGWIRFLSLLIIPVLIVLFTGISFGATYYVSASSTNTAWSTCTSSGTPCTPVTAMQNAAAGDVVNFLGGTYNLPCNTNHFEDNSLQPSNSGTNGNPIIFQANPGDVVTLVGNAATGSCDDGGVIGVNGAYGNSFIIISGFIIDTSQYPSRNNRAGVLIMNGASNIVIQNNEVIGHTTSVSDNYGGIYLPTGGSSILIQYNKIHDWQGPSGGNGIGGIFSCDLITIANNEIYNNNGHGILNKQGGNFHNYYYNYIHNVSGDCIHIMTQGRENTYGFNIYQNICSNTAGGVALDSSVGSNFTYTQINVYNNVFYNAGHSQYTQDNNTGLFYNNIIYLVSTRAASQMFATARDNATPSTLDYNCYYDPGGSPYWSLDLYGAHPANYSWSQWQSAGLDIHGYYSDPLFVNASSGPTGFRLQGGSLCYYGIGGSMGAYRTGTEIIGTNTAAETGAGSGGSVSYEGYLDQANCTQLAGWTWNPTQPNTPISVDIYDGGTKLATVSAVHYRADLAAAGIGSGYHAYSYTPSFHDGQTHTISAYYSGTSTALTGSPTVTPVCH